MRLPEAIEIRRSISVETTVDELWRSIVDDEELSAWMGMTARIDVIPGGVGRFDDGASVRRAVVDTVETGRLLRFTWWDEADPAEASTVELRLEPDHYDAARVGLTVTERVVARGSAAGARACSWHDLADGWEHRLGSLGLLASPKSPLATVSLDACTI